MPQPIAAVFWGRVTRILAKLEALRFEVGINLAAADLQQRTHKMQTRIKPLHRVHACQPGQTAATAKIRQNRLRLIFRVMR